MEYSTTIAFHVHMQTAEENIVHVQVHKQKYMYLVNTKCEVLLFGVVKFVATPNILQCNTVELPTVRQV